MSEQLADLMNELSAPDDPRMRAANDANGDDHGVNLSRLRDIAKRLKIQHELALELWGTGDTAGRLLATLVARPKLFTADELDTMIHEIRAPKLLDWFVVNLIKPGKLTEELRLRWKDQTGLVGRAGWSLTTDRVMKTPEGLDLEALLDQIEAEMKSAPEVKQWPMNHCLAEIGIRNPGLRDRAMAIGRKLEVLIDYPASPGCTSPYAPLWIEEMVRRREGADA
jgi:3-methyladenine DNA glycosylase AlkD